MHKSNVPSMPNFWVGAMCRPADGVMSFRIRDSSWAAVAAAPLPSSPSLIRVSASQEASKNGGSYGPTAGADVVFSVGGWHTQSVLDMTSRHQAPGA